MKNNENLKRASYEEKNPDSIKWYFDKTTADGKRRETTEIKRIPNEDGTFTFMEVRITIESDKDQDNGSGKMTEHRHERILRPDEMTNEQFEAYKAFSAEDYRETGNGNRRGANREVVCLDALLGTDHEPSTAQVREQEKVGCNPKFDHDRCTSLAEQIISNARLTEVQARRWRMSVEGKTLREIAKEEGCNLASVTECINGAKKKIEAAREKIMNPQDTEAKARREELLRARDACHECKYYHADNTGEWCTKHETWKTDTKTGEEVCFGRKPITEAVEDNEHARIRIDSETGKARIYGLDCWDCTEDDILDMMEQSY